MVGVEVVGVEGVEGAEVGSGSALDRLMAPGEGGWGEWAGGWVREEGE